ncbi:UNVERIFIED_CONTAM: hypothetical protein GTU68_008167 [Idotea baltica]|nr:hypothetical protein [Idotea baltica]
MADFRAIVGALTLYETDNGSLPRNRQGLEALIRPSTIQPIPRGFKTGGYLTELPADPWGNAYLYKGPTFGGSKGQYTIRTLGSDGVAGGAAESADIDSEYLKYIDHIGGCGSAS